MGGSDDNRMALRATRLLLLWLLLVSLLCGSTSQADEAPPRADACIDAAEQAQTLRDDGALLNALEQLQICGAAECPAAIRKDCLAWHAEIQTRLPTIVPQARDPQGHDVTTATLQIDGKEARLDGRAIAVDPGVHKLRWSNGSQHIEETLVARDGEKNRLVDAVFDKVPDDRTTKHSLATAGKPQPQTQQAPTNDEPLPNDGFEVPVAAWVLAGAGIAGGAVFAGLAITAKGHFDELDASCAPNCNVTNPSAVNQVENELLAANIAVGIGAAALAAAVIVTIVVNVNDNDDDDEAAPQTAQLALRPNGAAFMFSF